MNVTDPYEGPYLYDGETITVEARLTREQHDACFQAAGIPPAGYEPQASCCTIELPDSHRAGRLREHLCRQQIAHTSELCVSYRPDEAVAGEFEKIRELAASEPLPPELLSDLVRYRIATVDDAGDRLLAFLHRRLGYAGLSSRIQRGQREEQEVRELLGKLAALPDAVLDEAVEDAHCEDASSVNNSGPEEQLRYLIARDCRGAALEAIRQAGSGLSGQ